MDVVEDRGHRRAVDRGKHQAGAVEIAGLRFGPAFVGDPDEPRPLRRPGLVPQTARMLAYGPLASLTGV